MGDKHISSQFDNELNSISAKVMEMGGLVPSNSCTIGDKVDILVLRRIV